MMRRRVAPLWLLICLIATALGAAPAHAQELYPHTEPASNRPKGVMVVKPMLEVNQEWVRIAVRGYYTIKPPIMLYGGISTRYEGLQQYVPNRLLAEGAYIGVRWRFLSFDGPNRHFRMALGGEASGALHPAQHPPVHLWGQQTGGGLNLTATYLYKKLALSANVGGVATVGSAQWGELPVRYQAGQAINFALSAGMLVLPFRYKDYRQTNLNLYAELLGSYYTGGAITGLGLLPGTRAFTGPWFLEVAPAVQVIVRSRLRLDFAVRVPLVATEHHLTHYTGYLAAEYYLFGKQK